jgi:hypothetical protein
MKLFLLALFAKTNRLEGGTDFLRKAVEAPEFEGFVGQLYPNRRAELVGLWRQATGRKENVPAPAGGPEVARPASPEGRAEPPPAEPAAAPPLEPVRPLPDGLTDADLFAKAREYAQAGGTCARKVLQGDGASDWRQKAIQNFEQAETAVGRYLERSPDDGRAQQMRRDIMTMLGTLKKDMGFFDG